MTPVVHQPPSALIDAVHALIDESLNHLDTGDEVFVECALCGELDSHTNSCPIPACQRWMHEA
jgi:hypothetical protein